MTRQNVTPRTANREAAAAQAAHGRSACYLTTFDPRYAPRIASWVQSDQELTWLAPGTPPPLTARKVTAWGKDRDHRIMFWDGLHHTPIGYTELSKMPEQPQAMWIGHFLLDPTQRRRSLGSYFARVMLSLAFVEYSATDVLLIVFPDNAAAIRCYERAGLVVTGQERKYFEQTARRHTFLRMEINRARYRRLVGADRLPADPLPFIPANGAEKPPASLDDRWVSPPL